MNIEKFCKACEKASLYVKLVPETGEKVRFRFFSTSTYEGESEFTTTEQQIALAYARGRTKGHGGLPYDEEEMQLLFVNEALEAWKNMDAEAQQMFRVYMADEGYNIHGQLDHVKDAADAWGKLDEPARQRFLAHVDTKLGKLWKQRP